MKAKQTKLYARQVILDRINAKIKEARKAAEYRSEAKGGISEHSAS